MKRIVGGVLVLGALSCAATAADTNRVSKPAQSFTATAVDFGPVCGVVTVDVAPGPVKLQISGEADRVKPMHAAMQGKVLHVSGKACPHSILTGWHFLRALMQGGFFRDRDAYLKKLQVHVTVPEGMALSASDVSGVFHISNTHGPLHFVSQSAGDVFAGDVASADLTGQGAGDFKIGAVAGALKVRLYGSGDLSVGAVSGGADCATYGAGDIAIQSVRGSLTLSTSGVGDADIGSVQGAVHLVTSGVGDIRIKDGFAATFVARASGVGDITYGGSATQVDTQSSGVGDIYIHERN